MRSLCYILCYYTVLYVCCTVCPRIRILTEYIIMDHAKINHTTKFGTPIHYVIDRNLLTSERKLKNLTIILVGIQGRCVIRGLFERKSAMRYLFI